VYDGSATDPVVSISTPGDGTVKKIDVCMNEHRPATPELGAATLPLHLQYTYSPNRPSACIITEDTDAVDKNVKRFYAALWMGNDDEDRVVAAMGRNASTKR